MSRKIVPASPNKGASIDELALKIIRKYQPEILVQPAPFNIERFFECELEDLCGVRTDYRELPIGIYGYTDSDVLESVISSEIMDNPVQLYFARSTLAHETGHALIHVDEFRQKKVLLRSIHDKNHVNLRLYREVDVPVYQNPEWQAWRFAGALLMPSQTITTLVREGLNEKQLSNFFQVNPAFVQTRLRALKINI